MENAVPGIHPYEEWGYWRDVGTMEAYWQANMDVLGETPIFDLRNVKWPITTDALTDPVASMVRSQMDDAMVGQGSLVIDSTITRSIIGRNVRIGEGCTIEESIILDGTVIGSKCHLQRSIVDRFNVIESGTSLGGDKGRLGKRPSGKLGLTTVSRGKSYGGRAISSSSSPT
jgi:glucose-1-phosphate adenylyltransferase